MNKIYRKPRLVIDGDGTSEFFGSITIFGEEGADILIKTITEWKRDYYGN